MTRDRSQEEDGVVEYHFGRLIDHVHIRVADLQASKRFYKAVLQALGRDLGMEGDHYFSADELFVSDDELTSTPDTVKVIIVPDFSPTTLAPANPPFRPDRQRATSVPFFVR